MLEFRYTTFNKRILIQTIVASAALIGIAVTPNIAYADVLENTMDESQKSGIVSQQEDNNNINKEDNTELNLIKDGVSNENENNKDVGLNIENNTNPKTENIPPTLIENKVGLTSQNQTQSLTAASTPSLVQSGVSGTCTWKIYDDGSLIVSPTNPDDESGELADEFAPNTTNPWKNYRYQIKSVKFEKHIIAKNCTSMFSGFTQLTSVDLENLDASNAIDAKGMFLGCTALTNLDLSNFDISNATDTRAMFSNCTNLSSINFNNFKISKTTNISDMFSACSNLISLDLSSFDTSNVTDMGNMFYNCTNLTSVNLRSFDTSKVTRMSAMFSNCQSLISLDLTNFNTSNVTNMRSMFSQCTKLTNLNLSGFSNSNVTDMTGMFSGCTNLTNLNLKNFYTPKVTDMSGMFVLCQSLTSLDLSSFNTPEVTNTNAMFGGCQNLKTLDLSNFDTSKISNMISMFGGCQNLKTLLLSDKSAFDPSATLRESKWIDTNNVVYDTTASMLSANRTAPTTYRSFVSKIDDASVSNISDITYSGKEIKPKPIVSLNGETLTENTDYELSYSNNINAGEATITIIGKGDYAGTATKTFNIMKSDAATLDAAAIFEVDIPDTMTYGDDVNVTVTTKDGITGVGDVSVEYSSDSGVTWTDDTPKSVGIYDIRVTITGGDNVGSGVFTNPNWKIVILAKTFDGAETDIEPNSDVYTGKPVTITSIIVTSEGETLTEGVDYSVTYLDANGDTINPDKIIDSGVYTVKITGMNGYVNSDITVNFTIKKANQAPIRTNMLSVRRNNIAGVNRLMEYSNDNGVVWTSVPDDTTELTGLIEDSKYLVRFKGDDNHNPSEPIILTTGNNKVDNSSSDNNDTKLIAVDDKEPSNNTNDDTSKPSVKPDNKKDNTIKANRSLPETNNVTNGSKNNTEMNDDRNGAEMSATPETGDNMSNGVGLLTAILSSGLLSGLSLYMARRRKKSDSN